MKILNPKLRQFICFHAFASQARDSVKALVWDFGHRDFASVEEVLLLNSKSH